MIRILAAMSCLAGLALAGGRADAATLFERGLEAERELRIDEARDLFRQAVAVAPDAPGVAEHTAWFLYSNGFHDEECRDLLRRASVGAQEPDAMERAARQIERELGLRGPADEAEQEAVQAFHRRRIALAAETAPDERLGTVLVDAGDFTKGIPLLERAAAADPTNGPLALRLARSYVWAQQVAKAEGAYDALLARYPDNSALVRERARLIAGKVVPPVVTPLPEPVPLPPTVEALPSPEPQPAEASTFAQGKAAAKALRLYEARDLFRRALAEDPDAAGVAEHTAWVLFLNGFHDEECRDLLRQAMPKGSEPEAMERAARHVERELGLRGPASAEERQAKEEFDRRSVAKAAQGSAGERGGALVDAGRYDEGIPLLEQAVAANPADAPLELRLARAYVWAKRQAKADQAYARLLERHPGNPVLLLEQAQVAAGREMLTRSRGLLIEAERARPGDARILLERSRIEARLIDRRAAVAAVNRMSGRDQSRPLAVLARARAEHYRGQFGPARDGYLRALAFAPHLEEAALGLAECRLRRGELGSADQLLATWLPVERSLDWQPRTDLFAELTDPRHGLQFATYSNSLDFVEYNFGLDTRYHTSPETEVRAALVNSLSTQTGFTSIDRQGGFIDVASRPQDWLATHVRLGVNGYTNDWVTPVGGATVEMFPVHWLDVGGGAEYFNLIDFQAPFGVGIYDLVTTIGAVGEKISSTQGMLFARLRPWSGWTLYARARVASFTDGNLFQDDFVEAAYEFRPGPLRTRMSWAYYFLWLRNEASVFQPVSGGPSTPAYFSPAGLDVSTWNLEMSGRPRDGLEVGGEGHLYHILNNDGLGVGIFLYSRLELGNPLNVLRFDARYFTQDRGLTRDNTPTGSYDALNFVLSYDRRY
jgi:tetratricopeptide (TPR) repeat protein